MERTDHEKNNRLRIFGFNRIITCGTDTVRRGILFADTNFSPAVTKRNA